MMNIDDLIRKRQEEIGLDPTYVPPGSLNYFVELGIWAFKHAKPALEWINKPDHYEPDQYIQTACFQHRAYNALKEYPKDIRDKDDQ